MNELQHTQEDYDFYMKCLRGFPLLEGFSGTGYDSSGVRIPWGSGPHNVPAYREIVEIVRPKKIFEIGFNIGYGAGLWLNLCDCTLTSIDISNKTETRVAALILGDQFPDKFKFLNIDSRNIRNHDFDSFDMAFIDGDHTEDGATNDIQLCLDMGIKWLVMDDWLPNYGPGVQVSVAKFPLEIVNVWGNTALVKVKE